jgi:hypothetical protein
MAIDVSMYTHICTMAFEQTKIPSIRCSEQDADEVTTF